MAPGPELQVKEELATDVVDKEGYCEATMTKTPEKASPVTPTVAASDSERRPDRNRNSTWREDKEKAFAAKAGYKAMIKAQEWTKEYSKEYSKKYKRKRELAEARGEVVESKAKRPRRDSGGGVPAKDKGKSLAKYRPWDVPCYHDFVNHPRSFWDHAKVKKVLSLVFDSGESVELGAEKLGVIPEMLVNASETRNRITRNRKNRQILDFDEFDPESETYWEATPIVQLSQEILERKITIPEAAFQLGVAKNRVQRHHEDLLPDLAEEKEAEERAREEAEAAAAAAAEAEKKEKKSKVNAACWKNLTKALDVGEDNEGSAYAQLRRKNILERMRLFEQLDFGDSKDCARTPTGANKNKAKDELPMRQKSQRTKVKMEQEPTERDLMQVPDIAKNLPLDELVAMHENFLISRRFLRFARRELDHVNLWPENPAGTTESKEIPDPRKLCVAQYKEEGIKQEPVSAEEETAPSPVVKTEQQEADETEQEKPVSEEETALSSVIKTEQQDPDETGQEKADETGKEKADEVGQEKPDETDERVKSEPETDERVKEEPETEVSKAAAAKVKKHEKAAFYRDARNLRMKEEKEEEEREEEEDSSQLRVQASCGSMTPYFLMSGDVYPNPDLPMVAVGDITGALSLWLPNVGYKETAGHHCNFKVHAGAINTASFDRFQMGSVVTSGDDGHIRRVFLAPEQSVDLVHRRPLHLDQGGVDFHQQIGPNNFLLSHKKSDGGWRNGGYKSTYSICLQDESSRSTEICQAENPKTSFNGEFLISAICGKSVLIYDIRQLKGLPVSRVDDKRCEFMKADFATVNGPSSSGGRNLLVVKQIPVPFKSRTQRVAEVVTINSGGDGNTYPIIEVDSVSNPLTMAWRTAGDICGEMLNWVDSPAVWHPSRQETIVASTVSMTSGIECFALQEVSQDDVREFQDFYDFFPQCQNTLVSSPGGILSLNSARPGAVTLLRAGNFSHIQ